MPRKVFVANEILTASDVNEFLAEQVVMTFNDATARDTAITSPIEGMVVYLKNTDALLSYSGTAWVPAVNTASIVNANVTGVKLATGAVIQVVGAAKTDTQSTGLASGGTTAISGLSASITPLSTSSRIVVSVDVTGSVATIGGVESGTGFGLILKRGGTAISIGNSDGSRTRVSGNISQNPGSSGFRLSSGAFTVVDSPSTTSSITYTVDILNTMENTQTMFVNRQAVDDDAARTARGVSRITLMEVR
jgi:hypothetical protein